MLRQPCKGGYEAGPGRLWGEGALLCPRGVSAWRWGADACSHPSPKQTCQNTPCSTQSGGVRRASAGTLVSRRGKAGSQVRREACRTTLHSDGKSPHAACAQHQRAGGWPAASEQLPPEIRPHLHSKCGYKCFWQVQLSLSHVWIFSGRGKGKGGEGALAMGSSQGGIGGGGRPLQSVNITASGRYS